MTTDILLVLGITAVAIVLFASNRVRADGVALGTLLAVVAAGLLPPVTALRAFGNEAIVTVGAMFVISAGLTRTGAVGWVGRQILALGGRHPVRLTVVLMTASALISTFVNNTAVAVILLPITLGIARDTDLPASKLLIPMSYATIVGGMATVLGTSTNVLISSLLPSFDQAPLPLFEPLPLAAIGATMTIVYMATVGRSARRPQAR
jgi:di/tricarboxylate transporter